MALWDPKKKSSRRLFSTRHLIEREHRKSSWRELRVVLVLAAIVVPFAWWIHGPPRLVFADGSTWPARKDATPLPAHAADAPVARPAATRTVAATAERMPVAAAPAAAPPAFSGRLAELERRALAGDGKAALQLARALLECRSYVPISDAAVEDNVIDGLASVDAAPTALDGTPIAPVEILEAIRARVAERRAVCEGIGPGDLANVDGRAGLSWLIRAADAGETAAMVAYARHAFAGYDTFDPHAPQIVAEVPRVRDYLSRALALGDPAALGAYGDAYSLGLVFDADPLAAYAYYYAYVQVDSPGARMYDAVLVNLERALASGDIAQARERGRAMFAACCGPSSKP